MGDQQALSLRREPARVSRLESDMPGEPCAQGGEEGEGDPLIEGETWCKLDEDDRQLRTEAAGLRDESIQRRIGIGEPAIVRDRAWQLDRKPETGRHGGGPSLVRLALMRAVERAVDLDRVEALRVAFELAALGGKRGGVAARNGPAGRADAGRFSSRGPRHATATESSAAAPASAPSAWYRSRVSRNTA